MYGHVTWSKKRENSINVAMLAQGIYGFHANNNAHTHTYSPMTLGHPGSQIVDYRTIFCFTPHGD